MGRCDCHCPQESSSTSSSESTSGSSSQSTSGSSESGSSSGSSSSSSSSGSSGFILDYCGCSVLPQTWVMRVETAVWIDTQNFYELVTPVTLDNVPEFTTGEPTTKWVSREMVSELASSSFAHHGVKKYGSGFDAAGVGHQWYLQLGFIKTGEVDGVDVGYCQWDVQSFETRFGVGPSQADDIHLTRRFVLADDCLGIVGDHALDIWTPPETTWGGPPDNPAMNFYTGSTVEWEPAA